MEDEKNFTAKEYMRLLKDTLEYYNQKLTNVLFITADNCSVMQALSTRMNCPLVGCASHRLNLSVSKFIEPFKILILKINQLMITLCTLKNSAELKKKTHLRPLKYCPTRWSSCYFMIERYLNIKDFLDCKNFELSELMLSPREDRQILELFEHLKIIQSVTLKLQSDELNLSDVRELFDALMVHFPTLKSHISPKSKIVHSPAFESGAIKILNNFDEILTTQEKDSIAGFLKEPEGVENSEIQQVTNNSDFASRILAQKRIKLDFEQKNNSAYLDFNFEAPTSNVCERLFSTAGLIFSESRRRLTEEHLESILFIKANRNYWTIKDVADVVNMVDDSNTE